MVHLPLEIVSNSNMSDYSDYLVKVTDEVLTYSSYSSQGVYNPEGDYKILAINHYELGDVREFTFTYDSTEVFVLDNKDNTDYETKDGLKIHYVSSSLQSESRLKNVRIAVEGQ